MSKKGCGGPKTVEGKQRSSINRLRHGLRSQGLMRCRREDCTYIEYCPVKENFPVVWERIEVGEDCAWERHLVELHRNTSFGESGFDANQQNEVAVVEQLAITFVRKWRSDMALRVVTAGHPDQFRSVHLLFNRDAECSEAERPIVNCARRINGERKTAMLKAAPFVAGIIRLEKYKKRLNEQIAAEKANGNPQFVTKP